MSDIPDFPSSGGDIPDFPGAAPKPAAKPVDPKWKQSAPNITPWEEGKPADEPEEGFAHKLLSKFFSSPTGKNVTSIGDMFAGTPSAIVGSGLDIASRTADLGSQEPHAAVSARAAANYNAIMDKAGSPLHKLLVWAGLGKDDGEQAGFDRVMTKAAELVHSGGEVAQQKTKGYLNADDVDSIFHFAMAAAGGKGLVKGMVKLAKGAPNITLDAMKKSPQAEVAMRYTAAKKAQEEGKATAPSEMAEEPVQQAEKATVAKTRLADPKTLVMDPLTGSLHEAAPEPGEELLKPTTRETAINKVANGRAFDMTAEERIAYRGFEREEMPSPIVDEQGNILRAPPQSRTAYRGHFASQRGSFSWEKTSDPVLTWEKLKGLAEDTTLGSILDRSSYTLKTLDRLPQDKSQFSKSFIEQELKRQDVTDAEREAVRAAIAEVPGDKISAKELMAGVKKATGNFEFEKRPTDEFADYGLEGIGRVTEGMRDPLEVDEEGNVGLGKKTSGEVEASTNLYRLPFEVSRNNHFDDPKLFGWTRTFKEDGVRHVVEIQSDLAQRAGKVLTEEERANLEEDLANVKSQSRIVWALTRSQKDFKSGIRGAVEKLSELNPDFKLQLGSRLTEEDAADFGKDPEALVNEVLSDPRFAEEGQDYFAVRRFIFGYRERLGVLEQEHRSKLQGSVATEKVSPLLKNWYKRLVREELGEAAKDGEGNVRFATADTVAKVEGWPDQADLLHRNQNYYRRGSDEWNAYQKQLDELEGNQFFTEHQSIYDRYKRDVEKFLRQQGGKSFTDERGHTWIDVPTPRRGGRPGGPKQMYGSIDPRLMARLAAMGIGAWGGLYYSDHKSFMDAVLGAAAGLGLSQVKPRGVVNTFKRMMAPDPRLRINDIADGMEKSNMLAAVEVWALQKQIEDLAPTTEMRAKITHAIEAGDLSRLTPKERQAAAIAMQYFHDIGSTASLEGVLKSARDDYVTHIWNWSRNKGLFERWMERRGGAGGMSRSSPYAKERSIPTLREGMNQGLTPLTEDISVIMGIYGNSMSRAINASVFTRALKMEKVPGTELGLVTSAENAPASYVSINHPAMQGLRVHPDIAPSLKMLYDTSTPGAAMKIMQGLSDTSKRAAVSFSLFHAKALTDAYIAGSSNPVAALSTLPGLVAGTDVFLQELRKGAASPLVERAAEGGLKFSLEGEGAGVEDAGSGFYNTMTAMQGFLDRTIPGAGKPIAGLVELNHKVDTVMWARLHAGMKLRVFAEKYQLLLDNASKDPQSQLTPDMAARMAASYTNDLFGGLNWRRIAEDAKSRFGRELGQATLNPAARRVLGILAFAPDWTVSTTRAAVQAFGKGSGLKGIVSPTTLADLHRQYLLRSAAYYLIVGDAINYTMSGHHVWQNKSKKKDANWQDKIDAMTVLDMDPKGERHMQWSKHTMEPVHWITKPTQQAVNKLGIIPAEATQQILGVDYLRPGGRMPPMKSRIGHLMRRLEPISVQQGEDGGGASVVSGIAGVPIYGKTSEQRRKEREERKKEKRK